MEGATGEAVRCSEAGIWLVRTTAGTWPHLERYSFRGRRIDLERRLGRVE